MSERSRRSLAIGADLVDLGIRVYVARVFFLSGLQKLRDWDSTRALFRYEYQVPLLPPDVAAVLGALGELALPVLLALGLATRFAALGLSIVNVVAVVSYWHVLARLEPALAQHVYWATLLLVTLFHGGGRVAIDHWRTRRAARSRAS